MSGRPQRRDDAIRLHEPYRPRSVSCLEIWETRGWRLKVYGIAYRGDRPRPDVVSAAKCVAPSVLPEPAVGDSRYGVGFLGVHDGRGGNFIFVDWWQDENELNHHAFVSPSDRPAELQPADPIACVWDLSVLQHEREAWIRHVLARDTGPDVEAYLGDVLNAKL